jgi:dihydropteroate synthase
MSLPKLVLGRRTFHWGQRTYVMGVLNVTPDSFSDGGDYLDPDSAKHRAEGLLAAGVDIIDIGGESSRPFSEPVPGTEELRRVLPAIQAVRRFTDIPISIDTTKAVVAENALRIGADLVNDISALRFDPDMAEVIRSSGAPVILMHMKGTPRDMQVAPFYTNVVAEVRDFLAERLAWAVSQGIPRDHILLDPGIGFGKGIEDNLVLINRLDALASLEAPLVVGPSRKAFLGTITGREKPAERDVATLGAAAAAALRGAHVIRVHEIARTKEVLRVVDAIRNEGLAA